MSSSQIDALRDEVLSLKTERDSLKAELSAVRLENRSIKKTTTDATEPSGLSRSVSDLRVMALRRKRDVQNLEANHQEAGSTQCARHPKLARCNK